MDNITLIFILLITFIIILLIIIILIWIINDIHRIKKFRINNNNNNNNNNNQQQQHCSFPSSNLKTQQKHLYQPVELNEINPMNEHHHQQKQQNSFVSYVHNDSNKLIDHNNNNKNNDNNDNFDKSIKLRTFLMTFNNNNNDDNSNDYIIINNKQIINLIKKHSIPVQKFFEIYQSYSKDSDIGFTNEFMLLEHYSHNELHKKLSLVNLNDYCDINLKNRFQNVLPYKHTLAKLSDDQYGYINANFIDGYQVKNEYIATLAPWNNDSIKNFYHLIIKYNVKIIVNLVEFESIAYIPKWITDEPKHIQINMDNNKKLSIDIKLVNEIKHDQYVIRYIQLLYKNNDNDNDIITYDLYQFHFNAWKDFAVPEQELSILNFIKNVRQYYKRYCFKNKTPIIVHCRAGIGRTGTFIAIDQLWQQLTEKFLIPESHRKNIWQKSLRWNEMRYLHRKQQQQQQQSKMFEKFDTESGRHTIPRSNRQWIPYRFETITNLFRSTTETLGRPFYRKIIYTINNDDDDDNDDPIKQDIELSNLLLKSPYMIDIFSVVYRMRSNRRGMVQTDSQYAYIYRCVYYILKNWLCLQIDDENTEQLTIKN